ncbi:hypothetical protein MKW98_028201 [Papaver atlanticum]|uniref:Uncharacterized protein n=1 Tax=Papaver atlanticum TaxID=357466 RepID=A0AAD4XML0_9MAGN|nr:hypothetical protein MKW98_028201 [Papaver atlanticum]
MKKMMLKSVLITCITLLLLTALTEVTDGARRTPHRSKAVATDAARRTPHGSKAVATDSVAYPQECPCCQWGYSGYPNKYYLCQKICCKT